MQHGPLVVYPHPLAVALDTLAGRCPVITAGCHIWELDLDRWSAWCRHCGHEITMEDRA